ncbi:MAG: malate dehydrogenase [Gammaproteobacteria bacterium]|nr:malate dehydrogenase [Gammaproteobacteria bacterium]
MKKIITITGAAGNISYSLIFRLLSNPVYSNDVKIALKLFDISQFLPTLTGIKYEVEDCAFPSLNSIVTTDSAEEAFADSDLIIMAGAKPRSKGMQRSDLLLDNANIFKDQAKIINNNSKKTAKIIVVGNPANTNALIVNQFTPNIPDENITSLMLLDQNRSKSILSNKLNCSVTSISKLVVWGNHSTTQFPNIYNAFVNDKSVSDLVEEDWIKNDFIPRVQNRGAEIIQHRGKSSAASAASAIYDHINILINGSNDWESIGTMSKGIYDISKDIYFSFPTKISTSAINIINNINLNDFSIKQIKNSEAELLKERDIIKDLLK